MPRKRDRVSENPFDASHIKIPITAKSKEQAAMLKTIAENIITFVRGPAGSGKTFLSLAYAIHELLSKKFNHIIVTRPVVEAGEKLGHLPGEVLEKVSPFFSPVFEALSVLVDPETARKLIYRNGEIEPLIRIMPIAYMRGITFRHAIILSDESQNTTSKQMRMLLSRIGEGCKMIICGDTRQSDIYGHNGLSEAFEILQDINGVGLVILTKESIVRHPIIAEIEERYESQSV